MAADGPEQLNLSKEHIADFDKLVRETGALYKSRHYGSYHFLVTLSDEVAHFGLEHHQSSDDRVMATTFTDDREFVLDGLLLPHEFTHSWNGKYRRPAGLATSNYQKPMEGDLLWVYEGLTEYLGDVLAARCGIWTPDQYKQRLSTIAAEYDNRPGRTWRDIQDTATAAQTLYSTGGGWDNWRLSVDYYDEGELVWLDVDTTIRKMTNGKNTIDDFVAKFHGLGGDTGPKVVPYTFDDVVTDLNSVVANDWATFLRSRLDSNSYSRSVRRTRKRRLQARLHRQAELMERASQDRAERNPSTSGTPSVCMPTKRATSCPTSLRDGVCRQERHRPRHEDHGGQRSGLHPRCP